MINDFGGVNPIFRVENLQASIQYYVEALGFTIDFEDRDNFACVKRGKLGLFLCEKGQGNPGSWIWVGVGDVVPIHEEMRARGARIRQGPTNFPWAYEIQVEDLDGNVIRIGSDPLEGEPFGPWLDMHGKLWAF